MYWLYESIDYRVNLAIGLILLLVFIVWMKETWEDDRDV